MSDPGTTGTPTQDDYDVLGIPMPTNYGPRQEYPYQPPTRDVIIDGKMTKWNGPGVVNRNGRFEFYDESGNPGSYDLRNDPTQLYYSMGDEQRETLLDLLDRKGYNVDTAPRAISAISDLMEQSNVIGRTWDVTLRQMSKIAPDRSSSVAAPRYRVSSPQDITELANQVAKRTLGREFTLEESQRFAQSYQQQELAMQQQRSGVVVEPPSVDVAAEQFAQQVAPTEANAYKYLGAVNQLMRSVGEL